MMKKSNPPTLQFQFFVLVTAAQSALATINTYIGNQHALQLSLPQNTAKHKQNYTLQLHLQFTHKYC
jgi:hypothetical protein